MGTMEEALVESFLLASINKNAVGGVLAKLLALSVRYPINNFNLDQHL